MGPGKVWFSPHRLLAPAPNEVFFEVILRDPEVAQKQSLHSGRGKLRSKIFFARPSFHSGHRARSKNLRAAQTQTLPPISKYKPNFSSRKDLKFLGELSCRVFLFGVKYKYLTFEKFSHLD